MEFSTEVVQKMAGIMVHEMEQLGVAARGIRELETGLRELLRAVGAEALGQTLERTDQQQVTEKMRPCGCGGQLVYQFRRSAVILSVFGRVGYRRRYYTCSSCQQGQAPLDQQLGLAAGEVTAGLAELLALAGVEVAFEEASRLVERYLLFRVSDNTLRKETERFGALQQAQEAHWKQQSQATDWLQTRLRQCGPQPGRLYGSLDGVMVPLQGEWRELKNIAWYRVAPVRSYQKRRHHARRVGEQPELQAQDITYHCDLQPAAQFDELFWATACQRQADLMEELVFVCDGAAWIWNLIGRHFPHAVQIVDWYHACEYLPPVAEAAFGCETPEYAAWLQQARTQLWEGQIDDLLHECRLLGAKPAARPAVHTAVTYFTNNQHRMAYAHFRQQGYFIGSGTVESAGKQIATLRLKRAGARWTETGAVQTAKARAAWLSGQWEQLATARAALPLAA
ncbi:MAG: ISKra4 family transposase [Gammaproteobacteria bacterium]